MPISIRSFADVFARVTRELGLPVGRLVVNPEDFDVIVGSEMFDRYYESPDTVDFEQRNGAEGKFWDAWVNVDAGIPQGKVFVVPLADVNLKGVFYPLEPEPPPPPEVYRPTLWERLATDD